MMVWLFVSALGVQAVPGATRLPAGGRSFDVVVVQATPGGIMAAIAAARGGATVLLLERSEHLGGLPANGLGATDIGTRGATEGLFGEFVRRIESHYVSTYGPDSPQVKDCTGGLHFEPSLAERVFEQMLAEHPRITVLRERQFDARPENVTLENGRLTRAKLTDRRTGQAEWYEGKVFIDASYEGDLAAAAGAPFRTRREGKAEHDEPLAGRVYKQWHSEPHDLGEGSSGEGDDTIQAYNYRLCLTSDPSQRVAIEKPEGYDRGEYASLVEDVKLDRWTNASGRRGRELEVEGIGRVVNMVRLPNRKTDANNQHASFLSTDLPEENYPWPTADWAWRDRFAERLRAYTLGLLYFVQNDPELPEDFRARCREWGLASGEYGDNGHFPRQVYVREGRRIEGEHLFTAHDALPTTPGGRPPVYASSVTASHYALDSHAHRKREPGRVHLDGFLSHPTAPYTVPYGVMVPQKVEGLLTPVPVSGTHIGFSTLRMEPCWMALGQAAGVAAAESIRRGVPVRRVPIEALQDELIRQDAVLIYVRDVPPGHAHYAAVQYWALRGLIPGWEARPDEPLSPEQSAAWLKQSGLKLDLPPSLTRGQALQRLYDAR